MTEPQESLHFLDYWRVIHSRKEIVVAVFLLVVATGILVTYSLPKVYMASTLIRIKEESPDVPPFSDDAGVQRYDPLFLRTMFEIIQSRPVLEEVVRNLGLNEKLGKAYGYYDVMGEKSFDQTVKIVSRHMRVQQYRDTNLIQVRIYLSEPKNAAPQEAARVADEVAKVFREQNLTRSREVKERALDALQKSIVEQSNRVTRAEAKVEEIRKLYNISMSRPLYSAGVPLEKRRLEYLESLRTEANMELVQKKNKHDTVEKLSPEKLLGALEYISGDQRLSKLISQRSDAEVDLKRLRESGLGSKHLDVTSKEEALKEINKKLEEALEGLKIGIKADYEGARAKLASLEAEIDVEKAKDIKAEGEGYRDFEKAQEELEHQRRIRNALEIKYEEEKIALRIPKTTVEIIEPAKPPAADEPTSPKFLLNILLSIFVGLISGVGLAYFIEYLDTSVKTIEDIERFMEVPVIGVIPQKVKAFTEEGAETAHAEAYRVLRTNIQFSKKFSGGKTLCFTSGSIGEGKSLSLFNLAYVYAQLGDKVVIVDSDLHRPRQHRLLGVPNSQGLANVLSGEADLNDVLTPTKVPNLYLLPSGRLSSGAHGLLSSPRVNELIKVLKERFDIVFFDAPPIMGVSDASLLVRDVDGVVLVIQHRKYPRAISARAKDMIDNLGGNIVGVVLNNINISRDYSYYYQHYYNYPKYRLPQKT